MKKYLLDKGYSNIGNGLYSTVFSKKDSDRVIKVSSDIDYWFIFAQYVISLQEIPSIFPKIYSLSVKSDSRNEYSWYVAVVERLEMTMQKFLDEYKNDDREKILTDFSKIRSRFSWFNDSDDQRISKSMNELLKLRSFEKEMSSHGNDIGWDLHNGNWMFRKNGTIVLTDPWSGIHYDKLKYPTRYKRVNDRLVIK